MTQTWNSPLTPLTLTEDDLTMLATETEMAWHGGLTCAGVDIDPDTIREMAEELLRYRRLDASSVRIALSGGVRRSAIITEAGIRAMAEAEGVR